MMNIYRNSTGRVVHFLWRHVTIFIREVA